MPGELIPIVIVPAFFFALVEIVKTISNNSVRRSLIEKGEVDEGTKYLLTHISSSVPSSLKWGLVLIAVGAAVLIGQIAPYDMREEFTISGMFIMAGLALIFYYFIADKLKKPAESHLQEEK